MSDEIPPGDDQPLGLAGLLEEDEAQWLRLMSRVWSEKHKVEKPQDYRAKEETHATRNTNGTGPFKLAKWETDVKTVLVANPDYWGRRGNVTEAHYLVVSSAAAVSFAGSMFFVDRSAVMEVKQLIWKKAA